MIKSQPDTEDANLILKLYEIRRETRMRQARDFMLGEFAAESFDELVNKYPFGSEKNAFFRMVVSYWDMVASFVNRGLLNADLLFDTTGEFMLAWEKSKKLVPDMRDRFKNPLFMKNLEELNKRYEEHMNVQAPQYLTAWREMMRTIAQQRAQAAK